MMTQKEFIKILLLGISLSTSKEKDFAVAVDNKLGKLGEKSLAYHDKHEGAYQDIAFISKQRIEFMDEQFDILLQYPQIGGIRNISVQNALNSYFKSRALDVQSRVEKRIRGPVDMRTIHGIKGDVSLDYRITFNYNNILSIVFFEYQYGEDGYSLHNQSSDTYNLTTGNEYLLRDLFKRDANYISILNNLIRDQMRDRELYEIKERFHSVKDSDNYYLSKKGLVVYFQAFGENPFSYSIHEFLIPYDDIRHILKPEIITAIDSIMLIEAQGGDKI